MDASTMVDIHVHVHVDQKTIWPCMAHMRMVGARYVSFLILHVPF